MADEIMAELDRSSRAISSGIAKFDKINKDIKESQKEVRH